MVQTSMVNHGSDHLPARWLAMAQGLAPLRTAVVHPVDAASLLGAVEAARAGLIVPVLLGPGARIRAAAEHAGLDLAPYEIVSTEHSHAAVEAAVALARAGKVEALMKGALHTDELLHAVLDRVLGLRTARRVSHVFVIDTPGYPKPLFVTDAAINLYPSLADKRDIVQNAIDLAHALGLAEPKVAILSAVETVTETIRSTIDAAALCKMADRGQISGGLLDGPLPVRPTSWSCPTSKPATCSPSSSNTSRVPRSPAWCSAHACRSC
jgi:phosphate acetyltransferase/phosphate butyryltransferase